MDIALPASVENLEAMVSEGVEQFFTTMIDVNSELTEAYNAPTEEELSESGEPPASLLSSAESQVVGMVGFVGSMNGVIYFHLEESLSLEVCSKFLGMTMEEVMQEGNETVNDVMGEMSNMIVGVFKNKMSELGVECRMTIPSILRGSHFSIETPASVFRRIFKFKVMSKEFVADLTMKPGE